MVQVNKLTAALCRNKDMDSHRHLRKLAPRTTRDGTEMKLFLPCLHLSRVMSQLSQKLLYKIVHAIVTKLLYSEFIIQTVIVSPNKLSKHNCMLFSHDVIARFCVGVTKPRPHYNGCLQLEAHCFVCFAGASGLAARITQRCISSNS